MDIVDHHLQQYYSQFQFPDAAKINKSSIASVTD